MCGIAGILGCPDKGPENLHLVRGMLAALKHRGPDGQRARLFGGTVLGHARLAIIDLQTGEQPQADASGLIQVVANGEIYNYKEQRTALLAEGCRFRTQSDIEVIPHLYRRDGEGFVQGLRGMFALALHDQERGRLLLARDRLGKKPLYYMEWRGGLAFASEARALLTLPGVARRADPEALDLFLTYQYIPAPWCAWKGIRKLAAGHLLIKESGGALQVKRYWDVLPDPQAGMSLKKAVAGLEPLLSEATRLRQRSDVPLGVFLSGGIDSGLVCASLAEGSRPLAITVGFPGAQEDERFLARATASHLGLHLEEENIPFDLPRLVAKVLAHLDEPQGDSSVIPSYVVAQGAARHLKVVLSGDGGDESFAGYARRYGQNLVLDRLRHLLPGATARSLLGFLGCIYPKLDRLPRFMRLKHLLQNLGRDPAGGYALDMSILRPRQKEALYKPAFREKLDGFDSEQIIREPFERARGADLLSRLLYVDRHTYLAEGVLAKVDRMSMAHSLEVRSPLLDQEVVAFAATLPAALKLRGRQGKLCLRLLAGRRLPAGVVKAPKSGFAPPLGAWLKGPLKEMASSSILGPERWISSLVRPEAVARLFLEHQRGIRQHGRALWLLLVLEQWARNFAVEPLS